MASASPLLMNGALLVSEDFRKQVNPIPPADAVVEPSDNDLANWSLVRDQLASLVETHGGPKPQSDGDAAVIVHQSLDLNRRDASVDEMWHYGSVMACPAYVAWRWRGSDQVQKVRYLGGWERNALDRLWWIAELSMDPELPDPYIPTRKVASNQDFALWLVDSFASSSHETIQAMINASFDVVPQLNGVQIQSLFKEMGALRVTHAVDILEADGIRSLVTDRAEALKSSSA